jgi:adenylosuccinate synthase
MANTILVGGQWGDEGKGRIIDLLTRQADCVVRYQGGSNAGHEVHIGAKTYVMHLIPSGILHPAKVCVIGNGVVVDPIALLKEMDGLRKQGIRITPKNLVVSGIAHIVMPYHRLLDEGREHHSNRHRIGTTKRGIGPAYGDKASRTGFRVLDLLKPAAFREKLARRIKENNALLRSLGARPLDARAVAAEYLAAGRRLRPFIGDAVALLHEAMRRKKDILFEGAQGTYLDIDFGTYPYVTSSHPTSGGACVGSGVPPHRMDRVVGVMKAYTTRVGEGPFPTEYGAALGAEIQKVGDEFGRTTGRGRRCGWFDAVVARGAVRINGIDDLAITKLDVLDHLPEIKICVAYRLGSRRLDTMPMDADLLQRVKPIYETYRGWQVSTREIRRFRDLPRAAQVYLKAIQRHAGAPISIVSVGPRRDETIFVKGRA